MGIRSKPTTPLVTPNGITTVVTGIDENAQS